MTAPLVLRETCIDIDHDQGTCWVHTNHKPMLRLLGRMGFLLVESARLQPQSFWRFTGREDQIVFRRGKRRVSSSQAKALSQARGAKKPAGATRKGGSK